MKTWSIFRVRGFDKMTVAFDSPSLVEKYRGPLANEAKVEH